MNRAVLLIVCLLAVSHSAQSNVGGMVESQFLEGAAGVAEIFEQEHEGRPPRAWSDLLPYLEYPLDENDVRLRQVRPERRPEVLSRPRRYAFLAEPVHIKASEFEGDLLLMTRRPLRRQSRGPGWFIGRQFGEPGRYVIYRHRGGGFNRAFVNETDIQKAFRGREALLPPPDTEPLRPEEIAARQSLLWRNIALIIWLINLAFLTWAAWKMKRRSPAQGVKCGGCNVQRGHRSL